MLSLPHPMALPPRISVWPASRGQRRDFTKAVTATRMLQRVTLRSRKVNRQDVLPRQAQPLIARTYGQFTALRGRRVLDGDNDACGMLSTRPRRKCMTEAIRSEVEGPASAPTRRCARLC